MVLSLLLDFSIIIYQRKYFFIQTAFEVLKPFTRRQDIAAKQACYYKTLKEQAKKMDMEKLAMKDRERMVNIQLIKPFMLTSNVNLLIYSTNSTYICAKCIKNIP